MIRIELTDEQVRSLVTCLGAAHGAFAEMMNMAPSSIQAELSRQYAEAARDLASEIARQRNSQV